MERLKSITIIFLLAIGLLASAASAKPASVLLQEGLYAEEIEGDLDAAIKIYGQVITQAKATQRIAAQATYRIGMCYLKKGEKTNAAEYFQQIVSNYQTQKTLIEKATQQLKKIAPQQQARLPWEVMAYIVDIHTEVCKEAQLKGLPVNSHIYGVDDEFNKYFGGFLTFKNETGRVINEEIGLGNFSSRQEMELVNENGMPQKFRIVRRDTTSIGKYRLFWTPERPIQPGELRLLGYLRSGTQKLPETDDGYHLRMNNHFGSPVLENFFLVIPSNVRITEQSSNYISRKQLGVFDIYLWQREVPANTTNTVNVVLAKSEAVAGFTQLRSEIYDNTALDLDTGATMQLGKDWPKDFDVAWDNDGGGALMRNSKSSVRFLALGAAEKWEDAISMARDILAVLRTSTARGMLASQSKFVAILTSEGNLAVIQIGEYDESQATLYWWVEKIPAVGFGPVIELTVNDISTESDMLIDFESGKIFTIPKELKIADDFDHLFGAEDRGKVRAFFSWIQENGIDALADLNVSVPRLIGFDMAAIPRPRAWNRPADALADKMGGRAVGEIAFISAKPSSTRGWYIKTREGGMGVLEVVGLRDKPQGVKIRYKMLQKESAGRIVFLPDADDVIQQGKVAVVLDLTTGKMLPGNKDKQYFNKLNKGDVAYFDDEGKDLLVCFRGAKITRKTANGKYYDTPDQSHTDNTIHIYIIKKTPAEWTITTKEGDIYELKVLSLDNDQAKIKYRKIPAGGKVWTIKPDLSSPEATIKSFVKAVYDGNLEAAGACVSKDGHDYDEFKEMLATESNHPFQAMIKAMDVSVPVEITSKNIKDGKCKISWYLTLGRVYYFGETKMKKGMHQEFSSYLELVGDKWLIRDI